MNDLVRLLLLLCCLLALPLVVSAQDTQSVDLDGYSIAIPGDWEVTDNGNSFTMVGGGVTLTIITPAQLEAQGITFSANTTVRQAVDRLLVEFSVFDPEAPEILITASAGRPLASRSNRQDASTDETLFVVKLDAGEFGYLNFTVAKSQLALVRQYSKAIINSFIIGSPPATTAGIESTPCTVRASAADSAQLRVGPGTNRGAISFLSANTSVTATGRIVLDDGSIWFQLDKNQAAPNGTAAAELWVAEDQVALSGGCQTVGETNAPPVIRAAPQVVSPPASGESGTTPTTPVPGLLQPRNGSYTMTLAPVINASCTGGQNVPLNTAEVYEGEINYIYYIQVVDADSFYYGDDLYRRYPGSNSFDGIFTYEGGEQSSARIDVLSPTMVHGEINDLVPFDGYSCAATLLFNSTLN